jgi:formaldehyde-activating enzyme involved in methanogenesis
LAETLLTFLERAKATARRRTPPEHLDPDREGIFAKQEQRAVKKAVMDDVSYKASSSEAEETFILFVSHFIHIKRLLHDTSTAQTIYRL